MLGDEFQQGRNVKRSNSRPVLWDWKARVKYTVLLGGAEFVSEMRKLLRGDRDQQTGLRRAAREALAWPESGRDHGESFCISAAAAQGRRRFCWVEPADDSV
jgi:hypothetical protein